MDELTVLKTDGVFLSAYVRITDPLVRITGGDKNYYFVDPELAMIFFVIECLKVVAPLVVTPFLRLPYFLVEFTNKVI